MSSAPGSERDEGAQPAPRVGEESAPAGPPPPRAPRAVLFDLGDVLVRLRLERGMAHFARLAGCDTGRIADVAGPWLGERAHRCYAGAISTEQLLEELLGELGCPDVPLAQALAAWCDIFEPWPEMEALAAASIDAGHPTFLLSNTEPVHFSLLRARLPVLERFSGHHLSWEVKLAKPDPRFFRTALERFDLAPAACVFVDDRAENVSAARAEGIPSVLHRGDVDEVRTFLQAHGVRIG